MGASYEYHYPQLMFLWKNKKNIHVYLDTALICSSVYTKNLDSKTIAEMICIILLFTFLFFF